MAKYIDTDAGTLTIILRFITSSFANILPGCLNETSSINIAFAERSSSVYVCQQFGFPTTRSWRHFYRSLYDGRRGLCGGSLFHFVVDVTSGRCALGSGWPGGQCCLVSGCLRAIIHRASVARRGSA